MILAYNIAGAIIIANLTSSSMDIDNVPVLGKINRTLNVLIGNFVLLAVIFVALAVAMIIFPAVLQLLIALLLILSALVFLHIAYNVYTYKKKYTKWFK